MNSSSCVRINDEISDWFAIDSGVKQGCILSPVLFSMFIDDLARDIKSLGKGISLDGELIASLLYADDIVVLGNSEDDLQVILNCIDAWCGKWGIVINPGKSKVIHFRNKRKPLSTFAFNIGVHTLDYCHEYKYLGYWINEFLDINRSLEKVFIRANRALSVIIAKSKCMGGLPLSIFTRLFNVSVVPIFSYIAHLWAFSHSPLASRIQNSALRFFFGLGKAAPIAALLGDSGWPPIHLKLEYVLIKYWYRIGCMPLGRIPKKVFLWSMQLANKGKKTWVFLVNKRLSSINPYLSFNSRAHFCDSLWEALASEHLAAWRQEVCRNDSRESPSGGKLGIFRQIKFNPQSEPFARANLPVGVRRVMAGLRAGCLPLQIELGRYTLPKTPYDDRICKLCHSEVESQEHFLTRCHPLQATRSKLYDFTSRHYPEFSSYSDHEKTLFLLQPTANIFTSCKLIYQMYMLRTNLTYNL